MVSNPPPVKNSPVAGLWGQLVELWSGRNLPPPPPPEPGPMPVIDHALSSPPYPTPEPANPKRHQYEPFVLRLTTAQPSGKITVSTRPDHWLLYLKETSPSGTGVWVRPGEVAPFPPAPAAGETLPGSLWLSGTATIRLYAPEQALGFTLVGASDVTIIAIAIANLVVDREGGGEFLPAGSLLAAGQQKVTLYDTTVSALTTGNTTDAQANAINNLFVGARTQLHNGASWDMARTPKVFTPLSAVAVAAEATVWDPAAGKKFRLMGMIVAGSVAGDYIFRDNTAGAIIAIVPGLAAAPVAVNFGNGILSAAADNLLTCDGPALSTISGTLFGTEE